MTTSSATTPLKQIICIKWGTKYGADYVNKLYGMVSRNITPPFRFVCFTDNTDGIRPEIECQDLPPSDIVMPTNTLGKWPKSRLWNAQLGNVTGTVLFLDLDVVVVGSLDDFFSFGDDDQTVLSYNPSNPLEKLGQTSCFRFKVGSLVSLRRKCTTHSLGKSLTPPGALRVTKRCSKRYLSATPCGSARNFSSKLTKLPTLKRKHEV
jgi:hypothetical protein